MVCDDVKVEPDSSTRSMADLIGGIAAQGWKRHWLLRLAVLLRWRTYLRDSLGFDCCIFYEPPKLDAYISDLTLIEAFHEVQHLLP